MRQKVLIGIAATAFIISGVLIWRNFRDTEPVRRSRERIFICAKTGKPFEHTIQIGESEPIYSPHSKANTGYHAELCFWTKDENGEWKAKLDPTPVLLKSLFDPDAETVCPDCGHDVVGHNPRPPQELMDAAKRAAGQ
ncbi:MAG: hypothetical protein H6819_04275 [Phycisphaerales bacterium]|nr:hypothetical protein [Phycisphaerales bacterium]MCB9856415.1 hypothetical protein [Phycisphaerales bacterium]MCB9864546.1 hypothetical protein [Phycisphaerales bacterium]